MSRTKKNYRIEKGIALTDKNFFGDNHEHYYTIKCYDGYGLATRENNGVNEPRELKMVYPTLEEVLADRKKCTEVINYRGSQFNDINFGDIMLCYGKILKTA